MSRVLLRLNPSTALPRYSSVPRYAVTAEERRCLHRYTYRHNCMTASAPTFQSRPVGEGMHTMTAVATPAPPKLPLWQTEIRHRGAQPRAARTHLLAVGPDHGSGACGVGLAPWRLVGGSRRGGDSA